ncbi:MAG: 3-deoxy-manno-octulosonate cytidylyltransferase [Cryomorphaceae bacterium]|nr:3-deoxy-manno-octulosonate cytidylyltransferase [Cryomorphaceae bacterium]
MTTLGIIPARFASSRLPGKPLADIHGKPMIQWVYERAKPALQHLVVATDDQRIFDVVESFGGDCILTSTGHLNGSSRCREALDVWSDQRQLQPDVIINIQGDEPMLKHEAISDLIQIFAREEVEMATLASAATPRNIQSGSDVFLTTDINGKAMYFSRNVIPFQRDEPLENWPNTFPYLRHIGMYGFRPKALRTFAKLPESSLEVAEKLEQLRWLENGFALHVAITRHESGISVDTTSDLEEVRRIILEATKS